MPVTVEELMMFEIAVREHATADPRLPEEWRVLSERLDVLRTGLLAKIAVPGDTKPGYTNGIPARKMHEILEMIRRSVGGHDSVRASQWDDLIRFLDVMLCAHDWESIAAPLEPHKQVLKCKHCHYIHDAE